MDKFPRAMVKQIAKAQERKEKHVQSRKAALMMLFKDELQTRFWSAYWSGCVTCQ
jgi:hypothetical protein